MVRTLKPAPALQHGLDVDHIAAQDFDLGAVLLDPAA